MSKKIYVRNIDDEFVIKAKRVTSNLELKQRSAYNYKRTPSKSLFNQHRIKPITTPKVVVKITSNSKNANSLKSHIDYISRDGNLEIIDSDYIRYNGKDEIKFLKDNFINDGEIPPKSDKKREYRETFNMVFSMKELKDYELSNFKDAIFDTMKKNFPNNYFALAMHTDTDNPHCHICLKVKDFNGKRVDIRKAKLNKIKIDFSDELNTRGIESSSGVSYYGTDLKYFIKNKLDKNLENINRNFVEVINFGTDNYKKNHKEDETFFLTYETKNKVIKTIYSKDLKRLVEEKNIKKGSRIRLKIIEKKPIDLQLKKVISGKEIMQTKRIYKNIWDAILLDENREFKDTIKHKNIKKPYVLKEEFEKSKAMWDEYLGRKKKVIKEDNRVIITKENNKEEDDYFNSKEYKQRLQETRLLKEEYEKTSKEMQSQEQRILALRDRLLQKDRLLKEAKLKEQEKEFNKSKDEIDRSD